MHRRTYILRTTEDAAKLAERMRAAPITKPLKVEVSVAKKRRSLAQNALYWVWIDAIRLWLWESGVGHFDRDTGEVLRPYTADELHEWHKELFLPTPIVEVGGRVVKARRSTGSLNVQQFTDYLEQIEAYWGEQGFAVPHPGEYEEAMG